MTTCETLQPMLFDETELPTSTSSAGASPAKTLATLADALASKVRALVSGASMPGALARCAPVTVSSKTCQGSCQAVATWTWVTAQADLTTPHGSEYFSETWPRSGMMRHGIAYPLPPSVPLTNVTGCGLLPTITAKANMMAPSMQKWAAHRKLWPTPAARDYRHPNSKPDVERGRGKKGPPVITSTGGAAMCKWGGSGARARLRKIATPEELNGALNPDWVEWLMGFPIGFTSLPTCHGLQKASPTESDGSRLSVTRSSRKSRSSLAAPSSKLKG